MDIIHVIMKIRGQDAYFGGESYPHYEIGWKQGDVFHSWKGVEYTPDDLDSWKAI